MNKKPNKKRVGQIDGFTSPTHETGFWQVILRILVKNPSYELSSCCHHKKIESK